jgi:glycosyltransferase involved in cell wall biosynthesis
MRLLVVTQAVDRHNPVLGFFHRWLIEFSKEWDSIHVICLYEGEHNLPDNVSVHSLGKEQRKKKEWRIKKRVLYATRFVSLAWKYRNDYDAVFVHMNAEYVVLAGCLWRILGKNIGLWYNHTAGSLWLRFAAPLTHTLFHTSPYAYPARYPHAKKMPAGIDTELFTPKRVKKIPDSMYFQGRICFAKNVHVLIGVFSELLKEGKMKRLTLVGPEDASYTAPFRQRYHGLIRDGTIVFIGPVQNEKTPTLFSSHTVSVNLTAKGNYDKSVLESLACGTPVITTSEAFRDVPGIVFLKEFTAAAFPTKLPRGKEGRVYVEEHHSLPRLSRELRECYSQDSLQGRNS